MEIKRLNQQARVTARLGKAGAYQASAFLCQNPNFPHVWKIGLAII